jgi:Transposase DDE domain group 1
MFGRLAGYEDVNDADRLGRDPAMRWIVGGRAVMDHAASTSQMARFETGAMTSAENLTALAALSGRWIDRVQARRARTAFVLDIDSSVSPTYGAQEGTAYKLANFLRTLALPGEIAQWSLTILREMVVIGAKVVAHGRYLVFQMAEVAVPQELFRRLLDRIAGLRPPAVARC